MKTKLAKENIPQRIANIHQAPNGVWHVTDDAYEYLDETGPGYWSEQDAIRAVRKSRWWTHRIDRRGEIVRL